MKVLVSQRSHPIELICDEIFRGRKIELNGRIKLHTSLQFETGKLVKLIEKLVEMFHHFLPTFASFPGACVS